MSGCIVVLINPVPIFRTDVTCIFMYLAFFTRGKKNKSKGEDCIDPGVNFCALTFSLLFFSFNHFIKKIKI